MKEWNEAISEFLGECRHEEIERETMGDCGNPEYLCAICEIRFGIDYINMPTDYTCHSAWTDRVYDAIEISGLYRRMMAYMAEGRMEDESPIICNRPDVEGYETLPNGNIHFVNNWEFISMRATPPQKAEALYKTLQEVKNDSNK